MGCAFRKKVPSGRAGRPRARGLMAPARSGRPPAYGRPASPAGPCARGGGPAVGGGGHQGEPSSARALAASAGATLRAMRLTTSRKARALTSMMSGERERPR